MAWSASGRRAGWRRPRRRRCRRCPRICRRYAAASTPPHRCAREYSFWQAAGWSARVASAAARARSAKPLPPDGSAATHHGDLQRAGGGELGDRERHQRRALPVTATAGGRRSGARVAGQARLRGRGALLLLRVGRPIGPGGAAESVGAVARRLRNGRPIGPPDDQRAGLCRVHRDRPGSADLRDAVDEDLAVGPGGRGVGAGAAAVAEGSLSVAAYATRPGRRQPTPGMLLARRSRCNS